MEFKSKNSFQSLDKLIAELTTTKENSLSQLEEELLKKYKDEVLGLIEERSLQKWILFLPRKVSNIELKAIYQLANFTIYPSLYEGFGLPVLESQLCKTPVITSNISSLPEAASEKAFTIDPLNIEAIKTAMEHLMETSNQEDIQQESYSYSIQKFNPEKLSQALNKIYLDLLD